MTLGKPTLEQGGMETSKLNHLGSLSVVRRAIRILRDVKARHEAQLSLRKARFSMGNPQFQGPYERHGSVAGFYEEQWLWSHRERIKGVILDMSTPRYWHEWIYQLPSVSHVFISNLESVEVEKYGFRSPVDISGDFCAAEPPVSPNSFDTILCLSILEHCVDPRRMVTNLSKVLRPGGWLFINVPFTYPDGHCSPDYWRFGQDGLTLITSGVPLTDIEQGQSCDMWNLVGPTLGHSPNGRYYHRGLPLYNWLICRRRPDLSGESDGIESRF
jgi:hypothetical protein